MTSIQPLWAVEGGRVTIEGADLAPDKSDLPEVHVGSLPARVVHASRHSVSVIVPSGSEGGHTRVRIGTGLGEAVFIEVGTPVATGLHQVDSPAIGGDGTLYVTYSGTRGERSPVSVFRVRQDGFREPFVSGITNATSLAFAPDGRLYVSSRFDGAIYRVSPEGTFETVATNLGVACGLAFSPDGTLYVGDRSGTVFRVTSSGRVIPFATLPTSVAAYHLTWGPDDSLYLTGPTLSSYDSVYRIDLTGKVDEISSSFGRPQGLAFDSHGTLHVVEALAGASGLYRVESDGSVAHVLAASNLVGVAFAPGGGLAVASNDTVYRLNVEIYPIRH